MEKIPNNQAAENKEDKKVLIENPDYDENKNIYRGKIDNDAVEELRLADEVTPGEYVADNASPEVVNDEESSVNEEETPTNLELVDEEQERKEAGVNPYDNQQKAA